MVTQSGIGQKPDDHSILDHGIGDWFASFDTLDWVTRILVVVLIGFILWTYRTQIGAWIPGRRKK